MELITKQDVTGKANRYVLVGGDATLRDALQALADANGQEWWMLVIRAEAGIFRGRDFSIFRKWLEEGGPAALSLPLSERIDSFPALPVVELGSSREEAASKAASHNAPAVIVLDENDIIAGILVFNTTRSVLDPFAATRLLGLAGVAPQTSGAEPPEPSPGMKPPAPPAPKAPSPAVTPAPQPAERSRGVTLEGETTIAGDLIAGDQNIAGDNVHGDKITINVEGEKPKELRDQKRRFDVALPNEVHVGDAYELQVAVLLSDAASPFGVKDTKAVKGNEVAIPTPVNPQTGELEVIDIDVTVTAITGEVIGGRTKKLTVHPDGRTEIRWFMLKSSAPGKQIVRIEIEREGRRITEFKVENLAISPEAKPKGLLNLSLSIASFSLHLSFASG